MLHVRYNFRGLIFNLQMDLMAPHLMSSYIFSQPELVLSRDRGGGFFHVNWGRLKLKYLKSDFQSTFNSSFQFFIKNRLFDGLRSLQTGKNLNR